MVAEATAQTKIELLYRFIVLGNCSMVYVSSLVTQPPSGFQILATEGIELIRRQNGLDGCFLLGRQVGVLIERFAASVHP